MMQAALCLVPRESENIMTVSDKQFRDLSIEVAEMRGSLRAAVWIIGILSVAATGFGAAAVTWCFNLSTAVAKMQQAINDGGITRLVTELKSPSSPQQLRANLATVIAQVETAKANGIKANPEKVRALSGAVSQVVQKSPEVPEAWQAAAHLVSFRSQAETIPSGQCFSGTAHDLNPNLIPGPNDTGLYVVDTVMNCTFEIDTSEGSVAVLKQDYEKAVRDAAPKSTLLRLVFINAHIIYRGGPLLPWVNSYVFENCTFEWSLPTIPNPAGQNVTKNLLAAENLNKVTINGV